MKNFLFSTLAIQLFSIALSLFLVWQADQAMDKSGVGDVVLWRHYNSLSEIAFYAAYAFWVVALIAAVAGRRLFSPSAQMAIGIPPVVGFTGFFLYMIY